MKKQVIEFGGEAVGVVVPDAGGLRFVAVKFHVWDLDSRLFRSAEEARAAVRHLLASRQEQGSRLKTSDVAAAYAVA